MPICSSRQIAASRPAMISARSPSVSCDAVAGFEHHERGVDPGKFREPRAPRAFVGGQKPFEENRSVGNVATENVVSTEEAPGTAITAWPAAQPRAPA